MKSLPVFLFLITFSIACFSQNKFSFGPRVGYQVSKFNGEKHTNYSLGLYAGGFVQYQFSSAFTTEFDVLYSEQGGSRLTIKENPPGLDIPVSRETYTSNISLRSIELPLLINYSPLSDLSVKPRLILGPSIAFLLTAQDNRDITIEYNTLSVPPIPDPIFGEKAVTATVSNSENVSGEYQAVNLNANAGLGLDVPFNKFNLIIDLKYRLGITPVDISYNPLNKVNNSSQLRNNSIIFSIAFVLN
jgi:hypothetical protein